MRSPCGKRSLTGSEREARDQGRTAPATCWCASGQPGDTTHGVGRLLPHGDVTRPLKHFAVLRAFPGYCYSLISQYYLLCLFPYLAGDLGRVCGDFPPPCSSMLACTTAVVAAVTPPLQDLGQPTTSTVPTSVCHGGWIHPAQHPLQSCVLGEEL